MKLSEAIRLGAMLRPQGFGDFYTMDIVTGVPLTPIKMRSCALGAAVEAVQKQHISIDMVNAALDHHWPWAKEMVVVPQPAGTTKQRNYTVFSMIAHLNDVAMWTREAIADWVETVEPNETTPDVIVDTHELVTA